MSQGSGLSGTRPSCETYLVDLLIFKLLPGISLTISGEEEIRDHSCSGMCHDTSTFNQALLIGSELNRFLGVIQELLDQHFSRLSVLKLDINNY